MTQLTDDLQRILNEYPGHQHGFDYEFLSAEESEKIIQAARDEIIKLKAQVTTYRMMGNPEINVYYDDKTLEPLKYTNYEWTKDDKPDGEVTLK